MILIKIKPNLAFFVLIILLSSCSEEKTNNDRFKKLHEKAYSFYALDHDSTLFYGRKMKLIARTKAQKFQAFYMIGYASEHLNLRDLSLISYKKALRNSESRTNNVKCKISIASQLLSIGKSEEAKVLAKECLAHKTKYISYAHDLNATILLGEGKAKQSINHFRKSISLKNNNEKGFVYNHIANTFFKLKQIDSAIHYQKIAISKFPLKSANDRAKMATTLAKYLIVNKQIKSGLEWLKKAESIEGISTQSKALIQSIKIVHEQSEASLVRLETLTEVLVNESQNENDKLAEIKSAIDRYNDILSVHPANFIKTRCKTHIKDFKIYLEGVESGIQKGSIEGGLITEIFPKKTVKISPKKQSKWPPIIFIITLTLATLYFTISRLRKSKDKPDSRRVLIKNASTEINRIESLTSVKLSEENKYIIALLKSGKTFKEVSEITNIKEGTIRQRMRRIAEKGGKNDIRRLF